MGKFTGLLLIAAGVGVAVYAIPSNDAQQQRESAARFTPPDAQLRPMAEPGAAAITQALPIKTSALIPPRKYSSDKPLLLAEPALAIRSRPGEDKAATAASQKTAAAKPWGWPWSAVAKVAAGARAPAAADSAVRQPAELPVITVPSPPVTAPPSQFSATKPGDNKERLALVRELQKELARVGCFSGKIDGVWGAGSKAAMGAFTKRVKATLPVDEPDYILLTLVQGHVTKACGQSCSPRETLSIDGRCQPRAIQAASPRGTSDILASRVDKNSARIDSAVKSAPNDRLTAVIPSSRPPAVITDTQIRTPSMVPATNDAVRRQSAAQRRVAARKRGQARRLAAARRQTAKRELERQRAAIAVAQAEQRAQERRQAAAAEARDERRQAEIAAARDERRQSSQAAARSERRAEKRRQADIAASRAEERRQAANSAARAERRALSRPRAAAASARVRRASRASARRRAQATRRKARRRRIARAKFQRKSYLGAKKRRRSKPRRTYRRRRGSWKRGFWASQGM